MKSRGIVLFVIVGVVILIACYAWWSWVPKPLFTSVVNQSMKTSHFWERMTAADLHARGYNDASAYKAAYFSSIKRFSFDQILVLNKLTSEADALMPKIMRIIPWNIVKVGVDFEKGYPHTLGDTIVLSDAFFKGNDLLPTLIHEKIHVFQRKYPEMTQEIITRWGFIMSDDFKHPLARNNPDLDGHHYSIHGFTVVQLYNSHQPRDISDSRACAIGKYDIITGEDIWKHLQLPKCVRQIEHPYEIMACLLAYVFTKRSCLNLEEYELFHRLDMSCNCDGMLRLHHATTSQDSVRPH